MKTPSQLLRTLIFEADHPAWNEDELPKLKGWELEILCRLLGSPRTGTKEKVIVRLLTTRQVRIALAPYKCDEEGAAALSAANRRERLQWLCKQMCVWRSGNKLQMAITLLQWRDRARMEGKKFLDSIMRVPEPGSGIQLELKLL